MSNMLRKSLPWIVTGGAFLMVATSAGCSRVMSLFHGNSSVSNAQAESEKTTEADEVIAGHGPSDNAFVDAAPEHAPVVNVFGELDGVKGEALPGQSDVGFQQHTYVTEGSDSDVSIDPTGQWLLFTSTRHSEHPKIYLQRVDGQSVTQLTSDSSDDANPTFSPNGRQIAFASSRSGTWDIYVMDTDGKNVVQVSRGPMQDLHPSFSPDGGRLVYCSTGGRSNQWELWTVSLVNGERRMIGNGLFPSWSPSKDGDRIAFQRARQRGSRWFSLWTLDLVDGEARRVTEVAVSANAAIVAPCWSPDGKELAFATIVEPSLVKGDNAHAQQDIWTIASDGSNRRRLTDGNGTNLAPIWSVDNRVFFISDRSGAECVWSASAGETTSNVAGGAPDSKEISH